MELIDITKITGKKILCFGAHPDDLEFFAGATLSLLSKHNDISIIIATDGCMGTHNAEHSNSSVKAMREREARSAADILGIGAVTFYGYPDTQLVSYQKHLRKRILRDLLKIRPDIVFSFDPWGQYEPIIHPDHRTLAWAVIENILFCTLPLYLKNHGYSAVCLDPKPQVWLYGAAQENKTVDITEGIEKKLEALKKHESQFDSVWLFENAEKEVRELAENAGSTIGVQYGEGFRVIE